MLKKGAMCLRWGWYDYPLYACESLRRVAIKRMGTSCSKSPLRKWVLTIAERIWVKCKEELPECECYLKPGMDWKKAIELSTEIEAGKERDQSPLS
jgi:hypothetical protein